MHNEERLKALYRYDILDSPPEVSFDGMFVVMIKKDTEKKERDNNCIFSIDIAKLSSVVCATPMAAVSLVDKDRQWFKAKYVVMFIYFKKMTSLMTILLELVWKHRKHHSTFPFVLMPLMIPTTF